MIHPEKKLIETADGSHTIQRTDMDETYHSINGAWAESMHVFITNGFRRVPACANPVNILEVGFGTGLNAFQTYLEIHGTARKVHYVALEPDPLPKAYWAIMNYPDYAGIPDAYPVFAGMHQAAWDLPVFVGETFVLHKMSLRLEDAGLAEGAFHLIYFDAFAPSKQPELWQPDVMKRMFNALKKEGVLVTYAAQGELRRNLEGAGFLVERLQGAQGKREMLRAIKP